jgi:post-segregation antitoxin (ccd killing protein)
MRHTVGAAVDGRFYDQIIDLAKKRKLTVSRLIVAALRAELEREREAESNSKG